MATLGFAAAGVSVVLFGSNFVPVKRYDTGDGLFFQFIMCCAIFSVGMIVNAVRGAPEFHYIACLGGCLWCTGNVLSLLSLRCVGLAIGLSTWGATNLLSGWLIGKFGIIVAKEAIPRPVLNLIGVVVAVSATVAYAAIKPSLKGSGDGGQSDDAERQPSVLKSVTRRGGEINAIGPDAALLPAAGQGGYHDVDADALFGAPLRSVGEGSGERDLIGSLDPVLRRVVGVVAALLAGLLFGINFAPPIWYIDNHKDSGVSDELVDYVFAHFTGIFACSLFYFLVYCAYKKNHPVINPELVIPAFISGTLWAIAQASWFVATTELGLVVAYPLVASGPSLIGSLWGALVFREIRGKQNIILLIAASILLIISATLITLSRS